MLCGILRGRIRAPETPLEPTSFTVEVFRRDVTQGQGNIPGVSVAVESTILNETIEVVNRDPSLEYDGQNSENVFCVCVKINYEWIPIWVGCPD